MEEVYGSGLNTNKLMMSQSYNESSIDADEGNE